MKKNVLQVLHSKEINGKLFLNKGKFNWVTAVEMQKPELLLYLVFPNKY